MPPASAKCLPKAVISREIHPEIFVPRFIILSAAFLFALGVILPAHAGESRFKSPTGKYEVVIRELEHKKFTREEALKDVDNTNHVLHEVRFHDIGNPKYAPIKGKFADVYGWSPGDKPTPPETIFKWFEWSPKDDVVILPVEGWASAPGTNARKAIALNPSLKWKDADVALDNTVWADDWNVVGDLHADCNFQVDRFDAKIGETSPVKAAESPVGYVIKSKSGGKILIDQVLDNCRSEEDFKKFIPKCYSLNLDMLKIEGASCK